MSRSSVIAASSVLLFLATTTALAARAQQQPPVNPHARALADFKTRVDEYDAIRKKADDSAPPLKRTEDPREIKEAQHALVERIGAARAGAKQGDIFTPEVARIVGIQLGTAKSRMHRALGILRDAASADAHPATERLAEGRFA